MSALSIWVVCKHPVDYPDKYTLREHVVADGVVMPRSEVYLADELQTLQHWLKGHGLFRIEPDPADDPIIEEIWV